MMENRKEVPQNVRIELPYVPVTPLVGIYAQNLKIFIHKDMCSHMFTAALFTMAKTQKQLTCPSEMIG